MHRGSVRDILSKKKDNLPLKFRLKFAKDAAKGMLVLLFSILSFIIINIYYP